MSLTVYLTLAGAQLPVKPAQIWVREAGRTRQVRRQEWDLRFPGREPVTMISTEATTDEVYHANITHTLRAMAQAATIAAELWHPETLGITRAQELITPLRDGLARLRQSPGHYQPYAAPHGWGTYAQLVRFVEDYLAACERFPDATVRVSR